MQTEGARIALTLAGLAAIVAILFASYRMAFVDALSRLPNRRALDETLSRMSGTFAIAMIDIDHFKQFNDTHGHDAGDKVLYAVAQQLEQTAGARAFRYGGEEFCLLFPGWRARDAEGACEETRKRVESDTRAHPFGAGETKAGTSRAQDRRGRRARHHFHRHRDARCAFGNGRRSAQDGRSGALSRQVEGPKSRRLEITLVWIRHSAKRESALIYPLSRWRGRGLG